MRTVFRGACLGLLVFAASNCAQLKEKLMGAGADAAAEVDAAAAPAAAVEADSAAPAATTAPTATEELAGPKASNENDIARFPDETKLDNVAATVERSAPVREVPSTGKVVVTLNKGAKVTKIGERDKYFLVTFADPKNASSNLMGWLYQDSFTAASVVDAGAAADAGVAEKPLTCKTGETALISDNPFCGKVCKSDADCGSGQACKGTAHKLVKGKEGDVVPVCTVQVVHDAGAPTAKAPVTDGGPAGGTSSTVVKLPQFNGKIIKVRPLSK